MKKFIAPAIAFFLFSCNSGGPSPIVQKNMDAMHGVRDCFDKKDFSKLGDYVTEDAIDHAGEHGDIKGLGAMRTQFEKWSGEVDDPKTETIKELYDEEYGMSWNRYSGISKKDQMGLKAGDKMEMTSIEVAKFKDGKITEHWTFMTMDEMMKAMGPMPDAAAHPTLPIDSIKKDSATKR